MKALSFLLFFVLLAGAVSALGVSSPPLENNKLHLAEQGSTNYTFTLQNPEEQDVTVEIELASPIANLSPAQTTYVLPPKSFDTKVTIQIQAPPDAEIGSQYDVRYSVIPTAVAGSVIPVRAGISKKFTVEIVKNPRVFHLEDYFIAIIATIAIVLFYVWRTYYAKR